TTTQKQVQFAQLLHLKEVGVPIPDEVLLNAATVQNKTEITKAMEQQAQMAQQQAEQQQQIEQAKVQAELNVLNARATADQGLGMERVSRIQENQQLAVERAAQAQENRADARRADEQAVLAMAKTMKELESVDLENFAKFLSLAEMYSRFEDNQRQKDTINEVQQQQLFERLRNMQAGGMPGV
ncbi:MAG: hypothetical protein R3230_01390, partial [Nitrosopumilaceae archaeon]|nr:hypothetical protein [Nitrosopumilaceae archaeon]